MPTVNEKLDRDGGQLPLKTPTIVFLTYCWTEVTDYLRMGRSPAGTASVSKTWQHFARRGWDVHVLVVSDDPCPAKPKRSTELNGITFYWVKRTGFTFRAWCASHKLPFLHLLFTPIDWLKVIWTIRRYIHNADVYYSMRHAWGLVAWVLARATGGKCVVRYFGNFVYPAWRDKNILNILKTAPCLLIMKWPVDLHIITQDGSYGARVFGRLNVKVDKWRAWLNGVDRNPDTGYAAYMQARKRLAIPSSSPILLSISRLSKTKRQDRLIKCLPRILKEFPDSRLLLIGDGVKRHELKSLVATLNLSDHVSFLGSISHNKLHDYLAACDIFFQPNDHSSLSTTLIEALSAGCCCVVREAGQVNSIIENEQNAILLNPGEVEDISEAALRLLRDPKERWEFRRRAAADALNRFRTWEERLDMEVDHVGDLLGFATSGLAISADRGKTAVGQRPWPLAGSKYCRSVHKQHGPKRGSKWVRTLFGRSAKQHPSQQPLAEPAEEYSEFGN